MATALQRATFQGSWCVHLEHLREDKQGLLRNIARIFRQTILYLPHYFTEPLVRWPILPSSSPFFKIFYKPDISFFDQKAIQNGFYHATLTTPDNHELEAHFLKNPRHDQDHRSRVVILFLGNAEVYQTGSWKSFYETVQNLDVPISLMMFNPRNVGKSRNGTPNTRTLLIDAETVYQFVKHQLQISEDRIDLYGFSLGGAQAANLKKIHPHTGGKLILDRTFSDLNKQACFFLKETPKLISKFASWMISYFGWSFKTSESVRYVIKDPVIILYHPEDQMIPLETSLATDPELKSHAHIVVHSLRDKLKKPHLTNIAVYTTSAHVATFDELLINVNENFLEPSVFLEKHVYF